MKYYGKLVSTISFCLLILGLLPILYLGTYNHPTGDDYHYGIETHHIWESTHDILQVAGKACEGVVEQYQIWQGTYSAMFLMYLPPNIFGDAAYHLVTGCILLFLCGGIFYLLRKILCGWLQASDSTWITASSAIAMLWIQTVDFQSESFFWYNGSMYYTGFFAVTLFFWGILCTYLQNGKRRLIPALCILAFFLAGGNYVSLLPATILFVSLAGLLLFRRKGHLLIPLLPVYITLFAGFAVSALAPGNHVRQDGMWQISPFLAILKSLRQGIYFLLYMTDLWFVIVLLLITPLLWNTYKRITFDFRHPLPVMGFAYGVMCSAFCPTFYTMNSTGPGRAVAIMYYTFVLFVAFCYAYGLGFLQRLMQKRKMKIPNIPFYTLPLAIALLCIIQVTTGALSDLTVFRAIHCLASGDAAAYEAEYQERMDILADPREKVIVFSPYKVQPDLLYVGDFTGDAEHPTNQQVAEYFDKESIRVDWK